MITFILGYFIGQVILLLVLLVLSSLKEDEPICQDCVRLHEQLTQQAEEMFGLKRRIRNLTREVKGERRKNAHLRKDNDRQHVRKGQKRSRYGRN